MSNTDYSQTTLATQKAAQTQFAGLIAATADAAVTPSLVRMGGGATASTAISTSLGSTVAGATKVGEARPLTATSTPYSISKSIVAAAAAAAAKNNR